MPLDATELNNISKAYCRETYVEPNTVANLKTDDIKAAAEDLDTFITDNLVALNNALPEPYKSTATQPQKLRLFKLVAGQIELQ